MDSYSYFVSQLSLASLEAVHACVQGGVLPVLGGGSDPII